MDKLDQMVLNSRMMGLVFSGLSMFLLLVSVGVKGRFIDNTDSPLFRSHRVVDQDYTKAYKGLLTIDLLLLFIILPLTILLSFKKVSKMIVYISSTIFFILAYIRLLLSPMAVFSD